MRKDSWFRGALLSALFFMLLIGSAPTLADDESEPPSRLTAEHLRKWADMLEVAPMSTEPDDQQLAWLWIILDAGQAALCGQLANLLSVCESDYHACIERASYDYGTSTANEELALTRYDLALAQCDLAYERCQSRQDGRLSTLCQWLIPFNRVPDAGPARSRTTDATPAP